MKEIKEDISTSVFFACFSPVAYFLPVFKISKVVCDFMNVSLCKIQLQKKQNRFWGRAREVLSMTNVFGFVLLPVC